MSAAPPPSGGPSLFVIALTDDLFLTPRLEDAVRRVGGRLLLVDRPESLGAAGPPSRRSVPLTEPLDGPDASLLRRLVEDRPALLLVDTVCTGIPWARWIQVLKTSAATRRIPVAAFGPHVGRENLALAREMGADHVLPRGQLQAWLSRFLAEAVEHRAAAAVELGCDRAMSEAAQRGVVLVQAGEYFEAHEALEQAWMAEHGRGGDVYRALVQVAVLYLQITRDNYRGAIKMLLRMRQWLDPLPERCRGVDVAALRRNLQALQAELEARGPQDIHEFDRGLLRPIPLVSSDG